MEAIQRRAREALRKAICTRGKNKGRLLAKCPPVDTDEAAAWQAVMTFANPYKVGFGHLFFMSKERQELYEYMTNTFRESGVDLRKMDRDRAALDSLGVF